MIDRGGITVGVTGVGGPAGIAVVRAARASGYQVVGMDANSWAAGLRLAQQGEVVPLASSMAFAKSMLNIVKKYSIAAVVSTVAEEFSALRSIARQLEELGCRIDIPTEEAAENCVDKLKFAEVLQQGDIAHPPTTNVASKVKDIPGPWIVKPIRGRGSRGVRESDDLSKVIAHLSSGENLLAQSHIFGREFTADVLADEYGAVIISVPRWRVETKAGISVKGETFRSAKVAAACQAAVTATGMTGVSNIQGFVLEDETITLLELNPRFSGGLPLTLAAGANLVDMVIAHLVDSTNVYEQPSFREGIRMIRYFDEIFEETVI